jgi:hypothetical protein
MSILDLFKCECEGKFTIEPHGANDEFHVLYYGRCGHRHGYNLVELHDPASNCDFKHLEHLLNLGNKEYQKNPDRGHVAE